MVSLKWKDSTKTFNMTVSLDSSLSKMMGFFFYYFANKNPKLLITTSQIFLPNVEVCHNNKCLQVKHLTAIYKQCFVFKHTYTF